MSRIDRESIKIIGQHSNWSEKGIESTLKEHVYNGPDDWGRFLKLLFLALGTSFTVAGIIFFFAYNWADLHKFVKIGIVEGLNIAVMSAILFSKWSPLAKNALVTAACILVGVLLAIFGQVYQTGANAYDLFLGWTLLITLWVIISNFAPLWVVYITLLNISLILYAEQVAGDWHDSFVFAMLFAINSFSALFFILAPRFLDKIKQPQWFINLLVLASVSIGTVGVSKGILDDTDPSFWILLALVLVFYVIGLWHGIKNKQLISLSLIPFSVIIIISALLIRESEEAAMFFTVSFFIIISVTVLIKALINLQKKWKN